MLPIQVACLNKATAEDDQVRLMVKLIEVWPECAKEKSPDGWLLIHLMCEYQAPAKVQQTRLCQFSITHTYTTSGHIPYHAISDRQNRQDRRVDR